MYAGIPCILYGIAATFLISETEKVTVEQREIPIYFLIKEYWWGEEYLPFIKKFY